MLVNTYQNQKYCYSPEDNSIVRGAGDNVPLEKSDRIQKVIFPVDRQLVEEAVQDHVSSMTLGITENCNMRCAYCVYSGLFPDMRSHAPRSMCKETAMAAVDWLRKHSQKADHVSLYFFGGEPLLHFDLIRDVVQYAEATIGQDRLRFHISSNGTLISEEFAQWFADKDNRNIVITLNGPEELHDRLRLYSGQPHSSPFRDTMAGIERIRKRLKDDAFVARVSFLANYANVKEFVNIYKWYQEHRIQNVQFIPIILPPDSELKKKICSTSAYQERYMIRETYSQMMNEAVKSDEMPPFFRSKYSLLTAIHYRQQTAGRITVHPGFCVPFYTRCFVDVEGNLKFCEKTDALRAYGSVYQGKLDFDLLEKDLDFMSWLIDSVLECRNCPAVRMCQLCGANFLGIKQAQNVEVLKKWFLATCQKMRETLRRELTLYCSFLETAPGLLEALTAPDGNVYMIEKREQAIARILNGMDKNI